MKHNSFSMGFEIKTSPGAAPTPSQFIPWNKEAATSEYTPTSTLKYMNDALIGMNFHVLSQFKYASKSDQQFITNYLKSIDPYYEIYANASARLAEINKKSSIHKNFKNKEFVSHFENEFTQVLDKCFAQEGVQFKFIDEALNCITDFEKKLESALLYNFSVHFSESFTQKLVSFYSFLFHIRTVIAMSHNNQVEDTAFESVKCDSINDYLAKTDFTVNDALVYWQFKKLATPFIGSPDVRVERLLVNPLEQSFQKYNHNACALINNLPESFLTFHSAVQLEESLHIVQMDWLLGSSSGLLFRLREECYGIQHGYDKIFWTEAHQSKDKRHVSLKFCFELLESDFITTKKAG
jgi:hypothetical protein